MKSTRDKNPIAKILSENPFDTTEFARVVAEVGSAKAEEYIDIYKGSNGDMGAMAIFREAMDGEDGLVKINAILNAVSPEKRSFYLNIAFNCMLEIEAAAKNPEDALIEYKDKVKKWYDGVASKVTKEMNRIASSDLTRQERQDRFSIQTQLLRDANAQMNQKIANAAEHFAREAERPFELMVGLLSDQKIEPSKRQEVAAMMLDHAINGDKPRGVLKVLLLTNIDSLKLLESKSEAILKIATRDRTAITKDKTYDQIRDVVEAGLGDRSFLGKLFDRDVKDTQLCLFNMQSMMLYHSVLEAGLVDVSSKDAVINNLLVKFNAIMPDVGKGKNNPVVTEADLDKSLLQSVQRMVDSGKGKQAAELVCKMVMAAAHDKVSHAITNKNLEAKEAKKVEEPNVSPRVTPVNTPQSSPEWKPKTLEVNNPQPKSVAEQRYDASVSLINNEMSRVASICNRISENLHATLDEFARPAIRSKAKLDVMRDIFRPIVSEYVPVSGKIEHDFVPSEKIVKEIQELLNKSGDREANVKAAFSIAIKDFERSIDRQCGKFFQAKIDDAAIKMQEAQQQQQQSKQR